MNRSSSRGILIPYEVHRKKKRRFNVLDCVSKSPSLPDGVTDKDEAIKTSHVKNSHLRGLKWSYKPEEPAVGRRHIPRKAKTAGMEKVRTQLKLVEGVEVPFAKSVDPSDPLFDPFNISGTKIRKGLFTVEQREAKTRNKDKAFIASDLYAGEKKLYGLRQLKSAHSRLTEFKKRMVDILPKFPLQAQPRLWLEVAAQMIGSEFYVEVMDEVKMVKQMEGSSSNPVTVDSSELGAKENRESEPISAAAIGSNGLVAAGSIEEAEKIMVAGEVADTDDGGYDELDTEEDYSDKEEGDSNDDHQEDNGTEEEDEDYRDGDGKFSKYKTRQTRLRQHIHALTLGLLPRKLKRRALKKETVKKAIDYILSYCHSRGFSTRRVREGDKVRVIPYLQRTAIIAKIYAAYLGEFAGPGKPLKKSLFYKYCGIFTGSEIALQTGMDYIQVELVSFNIDITTFITSNALNCSPAFPSLASFNTSIYIYVWFVCYRGMTTWKASKNSLGFWKLAA